MASLRELSYDVKVPKSGNHMAIRLDELENLEKFFEGTSIEVDPYFGI